MLAHFLFFSARRSPYFDGDSLGGGGGGGYGAAPRYDDDGNSLGTIAALCLGAPLAYFVGQEYINNPAGFPGSLAAPKFNSRGVARSLKDLDLDMSSFGKDFPTAGALRKRINEVDLSTKSYKPTSAPASKSLSQAEILKQLDAVKAPGAPSAPARAAPKPALSQDDILRQLDAVTIGYTTQQHYIDEYYGFDKQAGQGATDTQQQYRDAYAEYYANNGAQQADNTQQQQQHVDGAQQQVAEMTQQQQLDGTQQVVAHNTQEVQVAEEAQYLNTQNTYQQGYEHQVADNTQQQYLDALNSYQQPTPAAHEKGNGMNNGYDDHSMF